MLKIPEQVSNFRNYSIPEHCIALKKRLKKQLAPLEDSTFVLRDVLAGNPPDTTPPGVRESLAECGIKFRTLKVPSDTVYSENVEGQYADALLLAWAARDTQWFLSLVDSVVANSRLLTPSDTFQKIAEAMEITTNAIFSFFPVPQNDFTLWDSLYTSIITNRFSNHNGDLKIFSQLISALAQQASRVSMFDTATAHRLRRSLVTKVDSLGVTDLDYNKEIGHPLQYSVYLIKHAKKAALLRLMEDSLTNLLRYQGPQQYIDALVGIEHASGFKDAEFPSRTGIGREMRDLPGNVVYKDGKLLLSETVSHSELANNEVYSYNPSQPYLVVYMESLCNSKGNMMESTRRDILRNLPIGVTTCMEFMEFLKWANNTYPEIKIAVWTPFRSQVGPKLTETPAKEVREFVQALDEFYDVSADIVMYNTDFYNMPDSLDRRRIDLSVDFLQWLNTVAPVMYERIPRMLLVGPDRKIVENNLSAKKFKALMEWYQKSVNVAGLGNKD